MTVDGVEDEVRTALRLTRDGDTTNLFWLANTPVGCRPEQVEDDPTTQPDEEADAYTWWAGTVGNAFTREDAVNVIVITGAAGDGDYAAIWPLEGEIGTLAAIAWLRVTEAALDEMLDYWLVYDITDYEAGMATGSVSVQEGRLRVDAEGVETEVDFEDCDYPPLREYLGSATGGFVSLGS